MTDVIVFVDALSPRELTGWFAEHQHGEMDAGELRVTPRVMSSIYTGLDPAANGMLEVSRYAGENTTRPRTSTIIDQAVREGMSVVAMGMPFCIPFNEMNEESVLSGDALQSQEIVPENRAGLVNQPSPSADMISDHPDTVFSSFLDQTHAYFKKAKEAIRGIDPDVAFIGYRLIDSYCHFQHTEERNGKPYRQHLIDHVQSLLSEIAGHVDGDGDVMFFSDHGQCELTDAFYVNQWLADEGYLSYKVDYDFIDTLTEHQGEDHPIDRRIEHQVTAGNPGVKVIEADSEVICDDPFDSCLTVLDDGIDREALRDGLLATGMYRDVHYKDELWDEDAAFFDVTPDVIPERDTGVFVTSNLHEAPIGMGYHRSGVHDRTACFGATRDLSVPSGVVRPEDLYDVIREFIGLELETPPVDLAEYSAREIELLGDHVGARG